MYRSLVKICSLLAIGTISHSVAHGQAMTLSPGDIQFTGINATRNNINALSGNADDKDVTFILLKAITAGTNFYITDYGWRNDVLAFQTGNPAGCPNTPAGAVTDGIIKWTATSNMPYGTQVNIRSQLALTATAGTVTAVEQATNLFSGAPQYITVQSGGEAVFAYQATSPRATPTFLGAFNYSPANWKQLVDLCTGDPGGSTLPASLSTNNYAISFGSTYTSAMPNMRINPNFQLPANPAAARTALANVANWSFTAAANPLPSTIQVLPVTVLSFAATSAGSKNMLAWETGVEYDIDQYEVEYSADATSFKPVGTVASANKTGSKYSFADIVRSGISYYRLKILESNGAVKYSKTVSVRSAALPASGVSIYPNPVAGKAVISISGAAPHNGELTITNAVGNEVYRSTASGTALEIDLAFLSDGLYFLHYGSEVAKFVKK